MSVIISDKRLDELRYEINTNGELWNFKTNRYQVQVALELLGACEKMSSENARLKAAVDEARPLIERYNRLVYWLETVPHIEIVRNNVLAQEWLAANPNPPEKED